MKINKSASLFCFSLVFLFLQGHAQIGGKKLYDNRVAALLKSSSLKYEVTSDGDFKLLYKFDDARSQLVFVNSDTQTFKDMEIREIWSIAAVSNTPFPASTLRQLLLDNDSKKLGSWKIIAVGTAEAVVFYVQIAADSEQTAFSNALELVSTAADSMEEQLSGSDDL